MLLALGMPDTPLLSPRSPMNYYYIFAALLWGFRLASVADTKLCHKPDSFIIISVCGGAHSAS